MTEICKSDWDDQKIGEAPLVLHTQIDDNGALYNEFAAPYTVSDGLATCSPYWPDPGVYKYAISYYRASDAGKVLTALDFIGRLSSVTIVDALSPVAYAIGDDICILPAICVKDLQNREFESSLSDLRNLYVSLFMPEMLVSGRNLNVAKLLKAKNANRGTSAITKLPASLKSTYDDLIKIGYNAIDDGASIVFYSANTPIAKIADNALHIKIPHGNGWAKQVYNTESLTILNHVQKNKKLYRIGSLDVSETTGAQYWSPENPLSFSKIENYANKYGIPVERLKGENKFIIIGEVQNNSVIVSRPAVPYGGATGGGIEIVTTPNSIKIESFHSISVK